MRHTFQTEAFGLRLRPVRMKDAAFIIWLRNLDHAKGRVGDSAADMAEQESWLTAYFERVGDFYFLVETLHGTPLGTCGIYDVSEQGAEFGRWIIRPGVAAAVGSAMLALDIAFNTMKLPALRTSTVESNQNVLTISEKFGFERQTALTNQLISGVQLNLVHFIQKREKWPKSRAGLLRLARFAERKILSWETHHSGIEPSSAEHGTMPVERFGWVKS